jgi:hypothetical protein
MAVIFAGLSCSSSKRTCEAQGSHGRCTQGGNAQEAAAKSAAAGLHDIIWTGPPGPPGHLFPVPSIACHMCADSQIHYDILSIQDVATQTPFKKLLLSKVTLLHRRHCLSSADCKVASMPCLCISIGNNPMRFFGSDAMSMGLMYLFILPGTCDEPSLGHAANRPEEPRVITRGAFPQLTLPRSANIEPRLPAPEPERRANLGPDGGPSPAPSHAPNAPDGARAAGGHSQAVHVAERDAAEGQPSCCFGTSQRRGIASCQQGPLRETCGFSRRGNSPRVVLGGCGSGAGGRGGSRRAAEGAVDTERCSAMQPS